MIKEIPLPMLYGTTEIELPTNFGPLIVRQKQKQAYYIGMCKDASETVKKRIHVIKADHTFDNDNAYYIGSAKKGNHFLHYFMEP